MTSVIAAVVQREDVPMPVSELRFVGVRTVFKCNAWKLRDRRSRWSFSDGEAVACSANLAGCETGTPLDWDSARARVACLHQLTFEFHGFSRVDHTPATPSPLSGHNPDQCRISVPPRTHYSTVTTPSTRRPRRPSQANAPCRRPPHSRSIVPSVD